MCCGATRWHWHVSEGSEGFHLFFSRLDVSADPHSEQTIFRQRFPMRRYNLERDGRLTNLAKAIE
jgi:hypothetical protein